MTNEEYNDIIVEIGPIVEEAFKILRDTMGIIPEHFGEGMVFGYLVGKGFSTQKALLGMHRFHLTMEKLKTDNPSINTSNDKGFIMGLDGKIEPKST